MLRQYVAEVNSVHRPWILRPVPEQDIEAALAKLITATHRR